MTLQVHVKIPRELSVCILFVVAKYMTFQSQLSITLTINRTAIFPVVRQDTEPGWPGVLSVDI
jgi:hypothetical protein